MRARRMLILGGLALAALAVGCVSVQPKDAALLDTTAANARAFEHAAEQDPAVPGYVKSYLSEDAAQWTDFANWANGRQPTTQASK